jgi:hypothetical protein
MGMWLNSSKSDLYEGLPAPESQGWLKCDEGYIIDWEDDEVKQTIQRALDFLDKGCRCKSGCATKCCSCLKQDKFFGAGCECSECSNVHICVNTTSNIPVEEICDSDGNDGNESSDEDSDEFEYEDSDTDKFSYKWR